MLDLRCHVIEDLIDNPEGFSCNDNFFDHELENHVPGEFNITIKTLVIEFDQDEEEVKEIQQ